MLHFLLGTLAQEVQKLYYIVGRISVRIRSTCLNPAEACFGAFYGTYGLAIP